MAFKIDISTKEAQKAIRELYKNLNILGSSSVKDTKEMAKLEKKLLKGLGADKAAKSIDHLKRSLGLTRLEVAKLQYSTGQYTASLKTMAGSVGSVFSSLSRANSTLVNFTAGYGLRELAKSFIDVAISADSMRVSLESALGSQKDAISTEKFLREESERLGLVFQDQVKGYVRIAAASQGTSLEGEKARDIWLGMAEASTALKLSSEETSAVLRAVNQIISKGKVQAEELRGQLGERLPGAFNIASKAMNMTTQQLSKQLELGNVYAFDFLPKFAAAYRDLYAGAIEKASHSVQAELNKTENTWFTLRDIIMADGGATSVLAKEIRYVHESVDLWIESNKVLLAQNTHDYIESMTVSVHKFVSITKDFYTWTQSLPSGTIKGGILGYALLGSGASATVAAIAAVIGAGSNLLSAFSDDVVLLSHNMGYGIEGLFTDIDRSSKEFKKFIEDNDLAVNISKENLIAALRKADIEEERLGVKLKKRLKDQRKEIEESDAAWLNWSMDIRDAAASISQDTINAMNSAGGLGDINDYSASTTPKTKNTMRDLYDKSENDLMLSGLSKHDKAVAKLMVTYNKWVGYNKQLMDMWLSNKKAILKSTEAIKKEKAAVEVADKAWKSYVDTAKAAQPEMDNFAASISDADREFSKLEVTQAKVYEQVQEEAFKKSISGLSQYNQEVKKIERTYQALIAKSPSLKDIYTQLMDLKIANIDTTYSMESEWSSFNDSFSNSFETGFANLFIDGLDGMGDAFRQWGDMIAESFARTVAQMVSDWLFFTTVKETGEKIAGGAVGAVGSAIFSMFHSGGVVGDTPPATKRVNPAIFSGAQRYHNGLAGDEFPAILQKGETVIPKGSTPVTPSVVVNIKNTGQDVDAESSGPTFDGEKWVFDILLKAKRRGTPQSRQLLGAN